MIMVVFIHSYNILNSPTGHIIQNNAYSFFIQEFISQGIARVSVPLFFIISGYLFYLKDDLRIPDFSLKIKRRFSTLVTPYFFWSIWGVALFFLLQILPQSKPFFSNHIIQEYSFNELLSTVVFNPIPYQLWFLRDLIVIVFLSPILYFIIKYLKLISVLFFFLTWILNFNFIIVLNESLLFFTLGAYFSLFRKDILQKDYFKYYLINTIFWLVLVLIKTILNYNDFQQGIFLPLIHKASIIIGIISVWSIYDFIFKNESKTNFIIAKYASFSFFLYVSHEPILTMLKKMAFKLLGQGEFKSLLIYLIVPIFTVSICILIGYYLKKGIPQLYGFITGSR